ncbi:hypothetical protein EB241_01485 [Erwinia psidii]|uniref:Uncharacterized protein n=1 Tax=Erwinia psidii TaxID=69224 RepID=A0A3N6SJ88_9GAMM|nr:hypothetical protein EB241_01485 [Erwinia psidii]
MIIKLTGIFIIGLCLVSFATCIIVYALHRKKYYRLLDEFQKKYTFPAPYSFHCLVGFFGAGPMAYFFLMLMKKREFFSWTETVKRMIFSKTEIISCQDG